MHNVEVDQQSHRFPAKLQIRNHLRLAHWRNSVHRFDFYDYKIVDQKIDPISEIQFCSSINYWQPNLSLRSNTGLSKFML